MQHMRILIGLVLFTGLILAGCSPAPASDPTGTGTSVDPTPSNDPGEETIVLSWQREGGIAGFYDKVIIDDEGHA